LISQQVVCRIQSQETPQMNPLIGHIFLPAIAPAAVIGLYFTPVEAFGCVNRGLMALAVVLVSTVAAFITVGIGLRMRALNPASSNWWLVSTLILVLPIALVLGPLG
jgi:hypothetical protein